MDVSLMSAGGSSLSLSDMPDCTNSYFNSKNEGISIAPLPCEVFITITSYM
jgi:hypothetical protein